MYWRWEASRGDPAIERRATQRGDSQDVSNPKEGRSARLRRARRPARRVLTLSDALAAISAVWVSMFPGCAGRIRKQLQLSRSDAPGCACRARSWPAGGSRRALFVCSHAIFRHSSDGTENCKRNETHSEISTKTRSHRPSARARWVNTLFSFGEKRLISLATTTRNRVNTLPALSFKDLRQTSFACCVSAFHGAGGMAPARHQRT